MLPPEAPVRTSRDGGPSWLDPFEHEKNTSSWLDWRGFAGVKLRATFCLWHLWRDLKMPSARTSPRPIIFGSSEKSMGKETCNSFRCKGFSDLGKPKQGASVASDQLLSMWLFNHVQPMFVQDPVEVTSWCQPTPNHPRSSKKRPCSFVNGPLLEVIMSLYRDPAFALVLSRSFALGVFQQF